MNNFRSIWYCIAFLFFMGCSAKKVDRPNIILILADDLGIMDIGAYAKKYVGEDLNKMFYESPNLNSLVAEGVAFSRAYAYHLCSPTRAAVLTGKNPARIGFNTATPLRATYYNQDSVPPAGYYYHDVLSHEDKILIPQALKNGTTNTALPAGTAYDEGQDEVTIAEALEDYESAFIGKWHVGGHGAAGYQPSDQGFKTLAWFDAGGSTYFNWRRSWSNRRKNRFPKIPQEEWMMGDPGQETGKQHMTADLTVQIENYLDERKEEKSPFFLYYCPFSVHSPWQATVEDSIYFAGKATKGWNGHFSDRYASMVKDLDNSVGAIMSKLEETGLDDNTIVVFLSDNGGWDERYAHNGMATVNAPFTGGKACLTEGGIRVPMIIWSKNMANQGWIESPVHATDLYPTILEMAGYEVPENLDINGQSLLSLIQDGPREYNTEQPRFWHYPFNVIVRNPYDNYPLTPHSAVMVGDHKLIYDWYGRVYLFNIKKDPYEKENLVKQNPDLTNALFSELMKWIDENVDDRYLPYPNEGYHPDKEVRKDSPFINLYALYQENPDLDITTLLNFQ